MADGTKVVLSTQHNPGFIHVDKVHQETADLVGKLLTENDSEYNIWYNYAGLHNHTVHQLLTLYALGATPKEVQIAYDINRGSQLPKRKEIITELISKFHDPAVFKKYLGRSEYYPEYLKFFQDEVNQKGIKQTILEYLFKGDEASNDLLSRAFDGFYHGFIHIGCGIEFNQPMVVAEGLAESAITGSFVAPFLDKADALAAKHGPSQATLIDLYRSIREDSVIANAIPESDNSGVKLFDTFLPNAGDKIVPYLAKFTVNSSQLQQKAAEIANANTLVMAAAQRPDKMEAMDFFFMHSVSVSLWLRVFLGLDWLSDSIKCKLVETKGRLDLVLHGQNKTPALYPDRIFNYKPKNPADGWAEIFARARRYREDGHGAKLIRGLKHAEDVSRKFYGLPGLELQPQYCLTVAHMVMDSIERMDSPDYRIPAGITQPGLDEEVLRIMVRWVRWCGMEKSWAYIPNKV
ncbi:hypothetical protein B7463_g4058, partial [Scytalidium lignicola]